MTSYTYTYSDYVKVIFEGSNNKLRMMLQSDKQTVNNRLIYLVRYAILVDDVDVMKILVDEFKFSITTQFIKTYYVSMSLEMMELFDQITGKANLKQIDENELVNLAVDAIQKKSINMLQKLINNGFDINKIKPKVFWSETKEYPDALEFMINNGYQLDHFSPMIINKMIQDGAIHTLKTLISSGYDIETINQTELPYDFTENYHTLTNMGMDPEHIAYAISNLDILPKKFGSQHQ